MHNDKNEKYSDIYLKGGYIDFGTVGEPSELVGFYSVQLDKTDFPTLTGISEKDNNVDYSKLYFSKIENFESTKQINKDVQYLCVKDKELSYKFSGYLFFGRCYSGLDNPKRAYGEWHVSNVVLIKKHGLLSISDNKMFMVQLSKYNKDGTYQTVMSIMASIEDYVTLSSDD